MYEPMTYFFDIRQGYDVQYMMKEDVIAEVNVAQQK
ncbi:choline transporter of high affinity [[Haemophilus] ducreyi]|nr:choline transporter of high affinity [[Haemophilus] ducreyi]